MSTTGRTELTFTVGKQVTYQYNGTDIPNKMSYNSYFTFQPAMNMIIALSYGTRRR